MALKLLASAAKGHPSAMPALFRLSRSVSSTSNAAAAQPQPAAAEADASESAAASQQGSTPRWLRELGVVRTDWT